MAGRLARYVGGTAEVTLRAPVPLGRALEIGAIEDGGFALRDGGRDLATVCPCELELEVPPTPDFEAALAVQGSCRAFQTHPFPECFVCGPRRHPGDGLCVYPGMVDSIAAAPWIPDTSLGGDDGFVDKAFLWAALDCTSAFPLLEDEASKVLEPLVLGRLAVEVSGQASIGERLVVSAWKIAFEGRRGFAGCALHRATGECIARARATWISIAGRQAVPAANS